MRQNIRKIFFLAIMLIPTFAFAEKFTYNYNGVNFMCVAKNNKVSIVGFDEHIDRVVIPAEVRNVVGRSFRVTNISIFSETISYETTEIAIEKGIKEIDDYCFYPFKNLKIVYVPTTIERFGKKAFNPNSFPSLKMAQDYAEKVSERSLRNGLAVTPYAIVSTPSFNAKLEDYGLGSTAKTTKPTKVEKPKEIKSIKAGTSDVDYNIPSTSINRDMTFCVIIANEDYEKTSHVNYARVDGETFKRYCLTTLGIPDDNIRMVTDATYIDMQEQLDWLIEVSSVYDSDAKYIFYYSGHGIPGDNGSCYMLPVEGDPNKESHGFSLRSLNEKLQQITASNASALVLMDACYSGCDRSDVSMFDGTKKGLVKTQEEKFYGNVVVMSAATDTQTSLSYDEKGHGLFTYFLLKRLQETKGNVTYGDLFDYLQTQVARRAVVSKSKKQTPSVNVSDALYNKWRSIKF